MEGTEPFKPAKETNWRSTGRSPFPFQVPCTTLAKKKNHHRDSRREERCSTCDIMLDQARSAQGKSDPRLSATFALRWSCLIEHDITRGTAFFSPRISRMVLFFGQGSRYVRLEREGFNFKQTNKKNYHFGEVQLFVDPTTGLLVLVL